MLDRIPLLHAEHRERLLRRLAREHLHQVVVERDVEAARALVALAARAPAELVVDAPRLVPLGADDVKPTEVLDGVEPADPVEHELARAVERVSQRVGAHARRLLVVDVRVARHPVPEQRQLQLRERHLLGVLLAHAQVRLGDLSVHAFTELLFC